MNIVILSIEKAKNTLEKLIKVQRSFDRVPWQNISQYYPSSFTKCANLNDEYNIQADLIILIRWTKVGEQLKNVIYPITEIVRHIDGNQRNRPYLASIILHYSLTGNFAAQMQNISSLFLHQFTHILGFNKTIFNTLNKISRQVTRNRMNSLTKTKLFFTGSIALTEARKYFGCSNLTGIELDESNGKEVNDGCSIHWSERILLGDYHWFKKNSF